MLRELKVTQRLARLLAFALTGTGTAALGAGAFDGTLTDNGTGDYTIAFAKPFARAPIVTASSLTAGIIIKIHAVSTTSLQIKTYAVDGTTATDAVIHIHAIGFDSADAT